MFLRLVGGKMVTTKVHTLKLAGELSLRQTAEVCEMLGDAVAGHEKIEVDGTGISEIHISIVQLLIAAFKTAEAANKSFTINFPADGALDKVLQRAGFVTPDGAPLTRERDAWVRSAG